MKTCKTYAETHRAGPGASTVLLILLVMCLAMLGALSLSVAKNDLAVTRRAVQAEQAWYSAQAEAANKLAEIDGDLKNARENGSGPEAIEGYSPETGLITCEIPVDEYRFLRLVLKPFSGDEAGRYALIEHSTCINDNTGGEYDQF